MDINIKQLLEYIDALNLALVDSSEYLDTHPEDKEALEYFDRARMLFNQATAEYVKYVGPLNKGDVNVKNGWTWVQNPMPWEREA